MTYDLSDPKAALEKVRGETLTSESSARRYYSPQFDDFAEALADEIVRLRSERSERDWAIANVMREYMKLLLDETNDSNLAQIIGSVK